MKFKRIKDLREDHDKFQKDITFRHFSTILFRI